jgi:hypothetical protein
MTLPGRAAQLRVLLHHALFQSFFGAARKRGERSGSPLTTTIFAQSFAALVLVALLFPETPPVRFAAATLSFSIALAGTAVLADWQAGEGSSADQAVVGTAPVTAGTQVLARVLHGLFFVTAVTLGTAVPPGILSFWVGGSAVYGLGYFVAALLCAVLAALLLVALLQGAEWLAGPRHALAIATALRTLLLAGGFVALALGIRAVRSGPETVPGGIELLRLVPTYWAARLLEPLGGRAAPPWGYAAALAALVTLVLLAHAALVLRPAPATRAARSTGGALSWLGSRARPGPERAYAELCGVLLRRERAFRLRALPLLLLPFAMALLAVLGDRSAAGEAFFAVVHQFPAMYLPILVPFLRGSEGFAARWITLTAPAEDRAAVHRGTALALLRRLFLPVAAVLCVVHALTFGLPGALATTGFALGVLMLLMPGALRALDVPPFSEDPDELGGQLDLGGMLFPALLLTVAALLFQALRTELPPASFLGLLLIALAARRLVRK